MSTTVWAAPAFRLKSRHILRFFAEARSPVRAVEVRLFRSDSLYSRTPVGSRRWESIGDDLARTAEDISKYIGDSGSPLATIRRTTSRGQGRGREGVLATAIAASTSGIGARV